MWIANRTVKRQMYTLNNVELQFTLADFMVDSL